MATIRNQVVEAFATKINAQRGLRFVDGEDLTMRSLWDVDEKAVKNKYGKHDATLTVQVQVILDARDAVSEGAALDAALGQLQTDALAYDPTFSDLVTGLSYVGSTYAFSEDGSSLVGLSAAFEINYQFLTTNPNSQGD